MKSLLPKPNFKISDLIMHLQTRWFTIPADIQSHTQFITSLSTLIRTQFITRSSLIAMSRLANPASPVCSCTVIGTVIFTAGAVLKFTSIYVLRDVDRLNIIIGFFWSREMTRHRPVLEIIGRLGIPRTQSARYGVGGVQAIDRCASIREYSKSEERHDSESNSGGGGWVPQWIKSRLPGGSRDELTVDSYVDSLKMARRLGGMTGSAFGSSNASDPAAQGSLLLFEKIFNQLTGEEKLEIEKVGFQRRAEVAQVVDCSMEQVDDCIARYLWTRRMTQQLAEYRKTGRSMPQNMQELEQAVGTWRSFKATSASQSTRGGASSTGSISIPVDAMNRNGQTCGLAGQTVGRSTRCPLLRKSYKACCGKSNVR